MHQNYCNVTNSTCPCNVSTDLDACPHVRNTYTLVAGTVIFVVIWPLIVFDLKIFPLSRGGSALLGATLMVVFKVITQSTVYRTLGNEDNLETLFLLIGMLLMNYYFDREGFLPIVAKRIFGEGRPFYQVLWKVCLFSGVLSSLVTNDATCIALTPVFIEQHVRQKRSDKEILPLLLGIATSANIGSAATIFGNPQNALIAASVNINLLDAFVTLLPAALLGLLLNTAMLYLFCIVYKVGIVGLRDRPAAAGYSQLEESRNNICTDNRPHHEQRDEFHSTRESGPALLSASSQHRDDIHRELEASTVPQAPLIHNQSLYSEVLQSQITGSLVRHNLHYRNTTRRRPYYSLPARRLRHYGSLDTVESGQQMEHSLSTDTPTQVVLQNDDEAEETPATEEEAWWRPRVFHTWLFCSLLVIVILLSIPSSVVEFNLGLVPVGVAVFTMVMDALTRRKSSYFAITSIDWYLIVMFMGLFVWLEGFKETRLPCMAFEACKDLLQLCTARGVVLFAVFMTLGSNIFSNVPLVILIVNQLNTICDGSCTNDCKLLGGVILAWVSTVSGNLTLFGSVANLIVADKVKLKAVDEQKMGNLDTNTVDKYKLTFFEYIKFGFISTIVVLSAGLPVTYFAAILYKHKC